MKKLRFISFLLTMALLGSLLAPAACASDILDQMEVDAKCALLVDVDNDEILYAQNAYEKAYPASITKVMTALLTLEAIDRGELSLTTMVTVSDTFSDGLAADGSTQNIKAGEIMSVYDLLCCLLIASANEASNILAEEVAGSISSFVELMNQRAEELGCTGTHFTNTHGLHDEDHYTTAYDIYLIAREAMAHEAFREIVSIADCYVDATNLSDQRHFYNTNALLSNLKYRGYTYQYATGIKTGSTNAAGHCLVSSATKDDKNLIAVVLGTVNVTQADGTVLYPVYSESARLLDWGFENFSRKTILDASLPVGQVGVTLSKESDQVMVCPETSLEATLPNDVSADDFQPSISLPESVEAPVSKGQVLGTLTLTYEGEEYGTVNLVAINDVELSQSLVRQAQIQDLLSRTWVKALIVVVLLLLAILILRLTLFRPRRRYGSHTRSRQNYRGRRR